MRDPEERRLRSKKSKKRQWSITDGDYVKKTLPGEQSYQSFRKKRKLSRILWTAFFIIAGYALIIFILTQLTKY